MEVYSMNDIYVLSKDFQIIGVIDTYESIIWRPAYYDVGDFELYMGASPQAIELLQRGNYIVRRSDATVEYGHTIYSKVMIIKNIQLTTDAENGDYITVTGRELKYLLHQRIVWEQTNLNGNVEDAIELLLNKNVISPDDPARKINTFMLSINIGLTDTITKQITGAYLDEAIMEICKAYDLGWEIYLLDDKYVFNLYKGVNRSYGQSERPYVVFSDNFDNILNSTYELNSEMYANTFLIAGEGEGVERVHATLDTGAVGIDRFESYVDARDISSNKGSANEISPEEYTALLLERGVERSAESSITEGFSGEVLDVTFAYGSDYYLGDTVTIINSYGISQNVKVLSMMESEDNTGLKLIPQFNI